jgi:hypothetical protein
MADFILEGGISKDYYIEEPKQVSPTKTSGVTGNLEYVKMLNNPKLTVKIITPKRGVVTSALSSDFGFSLGNNWSSLVPLSSLPLVSDIGQGVAGVLTAIAGATQVSLESLWMTSASWTGSRIPTFPVTLAFLNYTKQADSIYQMLALAEGALPPDIAYNSGLGGEAAEFIEGINSLQEDVSAGAVSLMSNVGGFFSGQDADEWMSKHKFMQNFADTLKHTSQWGVGAPCNYGLQPDPTASNSAFMPKPETTFALEIGNWFSANNLLIQDVNMTFSKEITPDGNPLILYMTVTFRPYRNISFKEFLAYFKTVDSSRFIGKSLGKSLGETIAKIGGNA